MTVVHPHSDADLLSVLRAGALLADGDHPDFDPSIPAVVGARRAADEPVLEKILAGGGRDDEADGPVRHVERLPFRAGRTADWPAWAHPDVVSALTARGIEVPWTHQREAADLVHEGQDVVLATGTASGKSLAYQLPVLSELLADPRACALYLAPTKALAADQIEALHEFDLPQIRPAVYDGDTGTADRDWARSHARWILTNPDMLHRGILPSHRRWARVLGSLKFVVVDECHAYRGVFGSHVGLVLRRLRRLAALYGSDPVFVLASATAADPAAAAERLTGRPARAVTQDGAPRPATDFVLWEPAVVSGRTGEHGAPVRRSAPVEAARMMADLVAAGARTLTFVRSRNSAEQTALSARRQLAATDPHLADSVAAYRGGYLPEDRRELERALGTGELRGIASTNALELGVDIAGLDAAVLAGYPGTLASVWQQAGRAGRRVRPDAPRPLVVFIARDDPLDTYLVHHPEAVFGRPVEAAVTDPGNPYVLGPHLVCAASEHHLSEADLSLFGPATAGVLADLVATKGLRRRAAGWFYAGHARPTDEVDLRGSGGGQVAIVEADTGRLLGTVDGARAPAAVHPGALHLHQGRTYLVLDLDLHEGIALVQEDYPEWTTVPRSVSTVAMTDFDTAHAVTDLAGGVRVGVGPVCVTEQVVGYLRRRPSGETIDQIGLDMPEHTLHTRAVWYSVDLATLLATGVREADLSGALHAAEHAAIGLLPLFAGCDRWDIGGLSTLLHPDTGDPTVIVYDGYPGGAGFADRGHDVLAAWLTAVRDAVDGCSCPTGCPSCVQSPKCGNGNDPLHKAGAVAVLDLMVRTLADLPAPPSRSTPAAGGARRTLQG
ncbi:DEAD/DEAH box helicase [Nakamurella flavida]|uniref:DEAD/DEAH box helicase n=1 Tax=Nakamurella flavida TaxID=363630 RepID=A0A938YN38_9ACTN|nr:DEAD/DEAH box helicase [Nakamurella flavida]MBM9476254.1 DEAD/DEAH box helicase [Nakamurella flavida]MDP9779648.1 DEAD/DEAH box helicase domain-containing protein [Nakamurella flavida]